MRFVPMEKMSSTKIGLMALEICIICITTAVCQASTHSNPSDTCQLRVYVCFDASHSVMRATAMHE